MSRISPFIFEALALLLVLAMSISAISVREANRDGAERLGRITTDVGDMRTERNKLAAHSDLPMLEHSWNAANLSFEACGLVQATLTTTKTGYTGSAKNWQGTVQGPPTSLFACLLEVQRSVPMIVDKVLIRSGMSVATVSYTVIGRM